MIVLYRKRPDSKGEFLMRVRTWINYTHSTVEISLVKVRQNKVVEKRTCYALV
jgi:hypothetical protein